MPVHEHTIDGADWRFPHAHAGEHRTECGSRSVQLHPDPGCEPSTLRRDEFPESAEPAAEPQYLATSPVGTKVNIPKELFIALSDFIATRKYPGSISIQFRRGEILCVEAVAKKTYRKS
jgi:hypothetical protein